MAIDLLQKQHGSMPDAWDYIADTSTHTGRWNGLMSSSDSPAVFTTLKIMKGETEVDFTAAGNNIPRDMMFPCFVTEVKLSSGVLFLAKS